MASYPVERQRQVSEGGQPVEPALVDRGHLVPVEGELLDAVQAEESSVHQVLDLVPAQPQDLQVVQAVKREALDLNELVLVQVQDLKMKKGQIQDPHSNIIRNTRGVQVKVNLN